MKITWAPYKRMLLNLYYRQAALARTTLEYVILELDLGKQSDIDFYNFVKEESDRQGQFIDDIHAMTKDL
jgi:hypothetical protein